MTTEVWKCDLCGLEFVGEMAQAKAVQCEACGLPPQKFELGQVVYDRFGVAVTVVNVKIVPATGGGHNYRYQVRYSRHMEEHPFKAHSTSWIKQGRLFATVEDHAAKQLTGMLQVALSL